MAKQASLIPTPFCKSDYNGKHMKKTLINLGFVVVSLLGILDAGYISYSTFSNTLPPCRPPFVCAEVLESPWAYIGGVPLSALGLLFYSTVFILAVLNYLQIKVSVPVLKTIPNTLRALAIFGFLFSLYLMSLMAFIIDGWCLYCLISAITSITLFVLSFGLEKNSPTASVTSE